MRKSVLFLLVMVVLTTATNASASSVIYQDGDFEEQHWTLFEDPLMNGGTVSATQTLSGGNPDKYLRVVNTIVAADGSGSSSGITGFLLRNDAVYDPATQGAISFINYSEDAIFIGTNSAGNEGQATGSAVLQDGKYYFSRREITGVTTSWHQLQQSGLVELDFRTTLDAEDHPDFSANGNPITLGFYRANTTRGSGYFTDAGIDNWAVTIQPVPLPGAVFLFAGALAGLIGIFPKKSQHGS